MGALPSVLPGSQKWFCFCLQEVMHLIGPQATMVKAGRPGTTVCFLVAMTAHRCFANK